jgi:2-keto-4-pentenoate hydratase/2-oxohepta-3-ene-1,7-dioic acid hydratase in catechol pathway
MRPNQAYCRFKNGESICWGELQNDTIFELGPGEQPIGVRTGRAVSVGDAELLAPCLPSKIVAVGLNYVEHIAEFGRTEVPTEPVIFLKAPSAMIGPEKSIEIPSGQESVDYEAELGVVIGKRGRHIPENEALSHVLGYTCVNDVTARTLQRKDGQWARSKSFDTFSPVGPWIVPGLDPRGLEVETFVNGKPVQKGNTSQMIFSVAQLIAFISSVMTLFPGDLLSTGTPKGVGPLKAGDTVEISIAGVGVLRNPVICAP